MISRLSPKTLRLSAAASKADAELCTESMTSAGECPVGAPSPPVLDAGGVSGGDVDEGETSLPKVAKVALPSRLPRDTCGGVRFFF